MPLSRSQFALIRVGNDSFSFPKAKVKVGPIRLVGRGGPYQLQSPWGNPEDLLTPHLTLTRRIEGSIPL